jgi:thiol:disulfide interchange protein/DsbC/DsbD-like thiol-disulfide interchange protein
LNAVLTKGVYPTTMTTLKFYKSLFLSLLISGTAASAYEAGAVRSDHVEAELFSELSVIQPGQPFWVGVELRHDPHWHTYWINPGDSGYETSLEWELPPGFVVGEIQWPYPERLVMDPLATYGYERDVLLMVEITPPATAPEAGEVALRVHAQWLECKEECYPGEARLMTIVRVGDDAVRDDENAALFERARAEWPITLSGWSFQGTATGDRVQVRATPPAGYEGAVDHADFFAHDPELIEYLPESNWRRDADGYAFDLVRNALFDHQPDRIRGVLVATTGWQGEGSGKAALVDIEMTPSRTDNAAPAESESAMTSLGGALLFAFLGGLILNLMPCVFPVISIKVMGFVQQAQEERAAIIKHGGLFALGVLVSFWILAGLLIALRAGGEQLGWGFHLQSPVFLVGMSVLFFLLGLNLFGVFEVGTTWMGIGQKAAGSSSWTGSFFSGALATVIATPCTAPFMGAALGYALTLSAFESLLIFTFLGLGMASPYMLLSLYPQWLKKIPRPGPWMETLKQSMGWMLVATVAWLAWVLNVMGGGAAVVLLVWVLFAVGLGAWVLGRWGTISRTFPVRLTAKIIASVLIFGSLAAGLQQVSRLGPADPGSSTAAGGMPWEAFSPERLAELRAAGTPVFVNFTAAWCLSCQYNERVAFSPERVVTAFREAGVVPMKADWTNRDAVIGEVLAGYGRSSVPFYVLYGAGSDTEPVNLPEILTPGIVLDAIRAL